MQSLAENLVAQVQQKLGVIPAEERLMEALHQGDDSELEALRALISRGSVNLDYRNGAEQAPMHLAAQNGYWDLVSFFVSSGAEIDVLDSNSRTPLHYACRAGKEKTVQTLLDLGADPTAKDFQGKAPGQVFAPEVEGARRSHVAQLVAKAQRPEEALVAACRRGDLAWATRLVRRVAVDARVKGAEGQDETPLQAASGGGHTDIVNLLLEKGAKLNGPSGARALDLAIAGNFNEIAEMLLDAEPKLYEYLEEKRRKANANDCGCFAGKSP
eukprot:CAMPEP_0194585030 /NCGR_PEP_ID=MMETSP0292-20121207/17474_1 /TAXON_ID=39354 /ORGANISM="Heterosigma akashiwo, Strain CCMP2393" /LENGTH=270 /DNA_ID=CAMNT_0039440329 /DNA_START=85 /DNA_END=897 /DNA_ORIENTATION=-